jgi:drug/metabolite transporter (DMT)-like permease
MTSSTARSRSLLAHLLLLAVVLVWGTTFTLVKSALADTTPLLFNLLRMALAFVALLAVNGPSLRGISRRDLGLGALSGLFLALGYQLQTAGLALTTPSKSAFLTGLVVVIVPLLSAIPGVAPAAALKPSLDTWFGTLMAFAGLLLLTTPAAGVPIGAGTAIFSGLGLGELLSLGCAIAFAAHLLMLARAAPLVSARRLGTLQIGFAALVMLLTLPLGGRPAFHSVAILWIALGVTALFATAAAFTIQSWAQQHLPASHTALLFTLEPVFAWVTSLLFFGERLGTRAMLGAGLILAGILLAELRPTSRPGAGLLPLTGA